MLFNVKHNTISEHIKNIFTEEETSVGFSDKSTGGRKPKIYNLDVIISVGYRVKSKQGIVFRKWAANMLYFLIKDPPFADGCKRIGAALFLKFLEINKLLFTSRNTKVISDSALVASTLMVAESKAEDKEMMISLILNFLKLQ